MAERSARPHPLSGGPGIAGGIPIGPEVESRRLFANKGEQLTGVININAVITDAARRASDAINAYITFMDRDELIRKWIAIKLADGSHDGTLYDSKRDAVKHQSDEYLCAYVCFRNLQQGTSPREMQVFLNFNREAYDRGFRLPDPDSQFGGPAVLMTTAQHDWQMNKIKREFWARNEELWHHLLRGER